MPGARDHVLERLVTNVPHSGFGDRGNGQGMGLIGDHRRQGVQERIDPRLAPILNLALRGESLVHQRLDDRKGGWRRWPGSGYRADFVYLGNCLIRHRSPRVKRVGRCNPLLRGQNSERRDHES